VDSPTAGVVEIVLHGTPRERASAAFLLENKYDRRIAVSLEMGDLVADGKAVIPGALIEVDPRSVTLPPRGQAVIRLAVEITDLFAPGSSYVGMLHASGFEARRIQVRLEVAASDAAAEVAAMTAVPPTEPDAPYTPTKSNAVRPKRAVKSKTRSAAATAKRRRARTIAKE